MIFFILLAPALTLIVDGKSCPQPVVNGGKNFSDNFHVFYIVIFSRDKETHLKESFRVTKLCLAGILSK